MTSFDYSPLETQCQLAAEQGLLHGLVISVGSANEELFQWAWGKASVEPVVAPMKADMRFDIASVTKVVATATASGICIDRCLIDPEAPARDYLPNLGHFDDTVIRVRDLASHTSGFDNQKFDHHDADAMLQHMITTPAQWPVGEAFCYSCRNIILLGLIVEAVTGTDLGTFCCENIFEPLGMSHTSFGPVLSGLDDVVPTVQPAGIISDEQARNAERPIGNAGVFSTASDLVTFCQMMLGAGSYRDVSILGEKALRWLINPCSPPHLPRRGFGWDMRIGEESLARPASFSDAAFGHGGWTGQSLWVDPALDRYVVILTNRTHASTRSIVDTGNPSKSFRAGFSDLVLSMLAT